MKKAKKAIIIIKIGSRQSNTITVVVICSQFLYQFFNIYDSLDTFYIHSHLLQPCRCEFWLLSFFTIYIYDSACLSGFCLVLSIISIYGATSLDGESFSGQRWKRSIVCDPEKYTNNYVFLHQNCDADKVHAEKRRLL